jgi:hypothetical protein
MDAKEFEETWDRLHKERHDLFQLRTNLETDLVEVRNKIVHLDSILAHMAPLAEIDWYNDVDGNINGLGLTDSVRHVLRNSQTRMSAKEIWESLKEKGYDFSGLSAPMASIYKILSRLIDDANEVEKEQDGDSPRVYYKWKVTPISDEDIPF